MTHFTDQWRDQAEQDTARTFIARLRQSRLFLADHGQQAEHRDEGEIAQNLRKMVMEYTLAPSDRQRRRALETVGAFALAALVELAEREEVRVDTGDAA